MKKRILKIIAIILGSVTGFVGAVIGVLALTGKLKTPVVYPSKISFSKSVYYIIDKNDEGVFSFRLNAEGDGEYEVTEKSCYFNILHGSNLIEFCNASGETITPNKKDTSYIFNCNEDIYYKLKTPTDADLTGSDYGYIKIKAYDSKKIVNPTETTIWIDREVKSIYLDKQGSTIDQTNKIQNVTIALNDSFDFNYTAQPTYSLTPNSDNQAKQVELYYLNADNDLVLVDETFANQNSFISYDNGTYSFVGNIAGEYNFRVAVFDTYNAKTTYDNDTSNEGNTYFEKTSQMEYSSLKVKVENSVITDVSMDNSTLSLDLYGETSVYLNTTDDNSMGLKMYRDNSANTTLDRLDEIGFNLNKAEKWTNSNLLIKTVKGTNVPNVEITLNQNGTARIVGLTVNETDPETEQVVAVDKSGTYNYTIIISAEGNKIAFTSANYNFSVNFTFGSVVLGNSKLISSLSMTINETNYTLKASGGALFVQSTTEEQVTTLTLKMLKTSSYLDFFTYQDQTYTLSSDFDYQVTSTDGIKNNRSWNILAKKSVEDLYLTILVVNSDGQVLIASMPMVVTETDLSFDLTSNSHTGTITYVASEEEGQVVYNKNYQSTAFSEFVTINAGTYDALLFITPQADKYSVSVVPEFTYTIGEPATTYVVVGYIDSEHNFHNQVKVTDENVETKLYVLQLVNEYGVSSETIINDTMTYEEEEPFALNPLVLGTDVEVKNSYISNAKCVTVTSKYQLINNVEISINSATTGYVIETDDDITIVDDNSVGGTEYTLTLSSPVNSMLTDVYNFISAYPSVNINDYFKFYLYNASGDLVSTQNDNLTITSVTADEANIAVTFTAKKPSDMTSTFKFVLIFQEQTILSKSIKVNSTTAQKVMLGIQNQDTGIELSNTQEKANESTLKLKVVINYAENNYKYDYSIWDGSTQLAVLSNLNTTSIDLSETSGFYATPVYAVNRIFTYGSSNSNVFDATNFSFAVGSAVMSITCEEGTSYLKVEVVSGEGFTFNAQSASQVQDTKQLADIVTYTYGDPAVDLIDNITISNIVVNSFGGSEQLVVDNINLTIKTSNGEDVVKIEDGAVTRVKYFYVGLQISFDIKVPTQATATTTTITFTSTIEINTNANWDKIYAGTDIVLAEESTDGNYVTEPYFKISTTGTSLSIQIAGTTIEKQTGKLYTYNNFADAGEYTIEFYYESNKIYSHKLKVIPNVIAGAIQTEYSSDTTYSLATAVPLYAYKSGTVYGATSGATYPTFSTDNISKFSLVTDYSNIYLVTESSLIFMDTSNDELTMDWLEVVGSHTNPEITLKVLNNGAYYQIYNGTLTVNNKYTTDTTSLTKFMAKADNLNVLTITPSDEVELTSIQAITDGISITNSGDNYYINNDLSEDQQVSLHYEYSCGLKTLTYDLTTTITPYFPTLKESVTQAYSGQSYDLLNEIFTISLSDTTLTNNVASLIVTNVSDESLFTISPIGKGYFDATSNYSANCTFALFEQQTRQVSITYTITYKTTVTATKAVTITIKNNQTIAITSPISNSQVSTNFNINAQDAQYLNSVQKDSGVYTITFDEYEVIALNTDRTIALKQDDFMSVKRVVVCSSADNSVVDDDFTIALAGIQSKSNARKYNDENNIVINNTNKTITFKFSNLYGKGLIGYYIFKVTSTQGAVSYIIFAPYCLNNSSDYNLNQTNIDVTVNSLGSSVPFVNNGVVCGKTIDYSTFLSGLQATRLSYYILSATELGNSQEYVFDNIPRYSQLTTEVIPTLTQYTTIKIAVVDSTNGYVFGTITVKIEPNNAVKAQSDSGMTSVDAGIYEKTVTTMNDILYTELFDTAIVPTITISYEDESLATDSPISAENGTIKFANFVTQDIQFVATYNFDGLITQVNFTYKGITIPTDSTIAVVGSFTSGEGFDYTLDLSDYIGEYIGALSTTGSDMSVDSVDDRKLTFTAKYCDYSTTIVVKYVNVENQPTRTIDVTVKSAINITFNATTDSGYSAGQAKLTTATTSYDSEVGSTLTITKNSEATTYDEYSVGGLTISVLSGSLNISAVGTNSSYVIFGANDSVTLANTSTINFNHAMTEKPLTLIIKAIDSSSNVYSSILAGVATEREINFYVKVAQTYTGLVANYSVISANHDNIVGGSTLDIDTYLFSAISSVEENVNNTNRLGIVKVDGNVTYNFTALGFKTTGNPNCLSLYLGNNLQYKTNSTTEIVFSEVGVTTTTSIVIQNTAGASVTYYFNVLPNSTTIVLDTTNINVVSTATNIGFLVDDEILSSDLEFIVNASNNDGFAHLANSNDNVLYIKDASQIRYKNVDNQDVISNIISKSGYELSFSLDSQKNIGITLHRYAGTAIATDDIEFTDIKIYSNSGLIATLNIKFFINKDITTSSSVASIYAGNSFNLLNKITNDSSASIELDLTTSYYSVGGNLVTDLTENDLFTYDANTYKISTNLVPSDTNVSISYSYMYGEEFDGQHRYKVAQGTYPFIVKVNRQFVVNGSTLDNDTKFYSTYALSTNKLNEGNFPHKDNLLDTDTATTNNLTLSLANGLGTQLSNAKELAYNHVNIVVSKIKLNNTYVTDSDTIASIVTIDKSTTNCVYLTFVKDYTGEITITLSYDTNLGTYSKEWVIDVTGLIELTYLTPSIDTVITKSDGSALQSGTTVKVITIETTNNATSAVNMVMPEEKIAYTATIKYAVLSIADMTDASWIDSSTYTYNTSDTLVGVTVTMPKVTQSVSTNRVYSYVAYKIVLQYCNMTTSEFYALYKVYDDRTLSLNASVVNINTADILTSNKIVVASNSGNALYKYSSETEDITTTGVTKLVVGDNEYELEKDASNRLVTKNAVTNLFNNSYEGTIKLVGTTGTIVEDSIKLIGNKTLTYKNAVNLSSIFQDGSWLDNNEGDATDYAIVGIGTPKAGWINNAGSTTNPVAISSFAYNGTTFAVYSATFTSSETDVYTVSTEFYYLVVNGTTSTTTFNAIDYEHVSLEHFVVVNGDTLTNADLDGIIAKYSSGEDSGITIDNNTTVTIISGASVTFAENETETYKYATISYGGTSYTIRVKFIKVA